MSLFRRAVHHELAAGITILAGTQFAASVAGLIRDRVLSQTFQTNLSVVDAYIAAFRPSDLIFQTCIMSAMGTVLVPVLAQYYAKNNRPEMLKVLNATMGIAALIFGVLALFLGIFFDHIAPYLVQFTGEELALYIRFGRLALLTNFLFVFGNALGQYLITVQRYWIYGITPVLYTVGTILGTIFLTPMVGPQGPILGTLIGAVAYVVLRLGGVLWGGDRVSLGFWHPDIKEMGYLMIPRVLSLGAFQVQLLFLDRIASGLPQGAVTINAFTRNFASVLVGVIGIAIAQSVYSTLSQAAATKDDAKFKRYFHQGSLICLALSLIGALALVIAAPIAAWLVHLSSVLRTFTVCLALYALSVPFESLSHLQLRAFYARKNTLTPAICGIIGGAGAVLSSAIFVPRYGLYAVAFGFTVGEILRTLGLWMMLKKHDG